MIKVYLNRKVSETQITIGNQYESGVNAIAFDLSELKEKWPNGNIYLLVSRKAHTWPYSIDDGEFKVEYVLTWKRGFYQMNVVVTDEKITDQLESSNTIFVSDTINAYVNENQINAKALNEQELPRELQIVYDDLITLKKNIEKDLADGKYIGPQGPKGEPGDVTEEYRNLASQIAQNASDAQTSATNAQVSATNAQKALDDTKDFVNQTKTELNQIKTDTRALKDEANTSAVNAQASATSAQESATNASQSATSAQVSATNAQTSASNAQKAFDDTKEFVNQTKTELNQIKTDTRALKDEANASAVNAKASETKAKEYADNLKESTDAISQNTKAISELADKKITKFYASNQGETHITDSDNGKIQDMMIYGKSSQDGTPSPENPVEIKSVVNPTIKLLGSNILKIPDGEYQQSGLTITVSNGVVELKGTAESDIIDITLTRQDKLSFKAGTELIFSPNNVNDTEQNACYLDFSNDRTKGFSVVNNNINTPYIITENDTKHPFGLYIRIHEGATYERIWKPQVLIGKTITPFKPYIEQSVTLPITLNAISIIRGGNVTIDGQEYIADYIDLDCGKLVKHLYAGKLSDLQYTLNYSLDNKWYDSSISNSFELTNLSYKGISFKSSSMTTGFFNKAKTYTFTGFYAKGIECGVMNSEGYMVINLPISLGISTPDLFREWANECYIIKMLTIPIESNLTVEEIEAFKKLSAYYPITNISVASEQLDGYTVFNYPISLANGWNYVKQQLNDNRDYIYDMDLQSAEAYVNSEYAVTLTELEV